MADHSLVSGFSNWCGCFRLIVWHWTLTDGLVSGPVGLLTILTAVWDIHAPSTMLQSRWFLTTRSTSTSGSNRRFGTFQLLLSARTLTHGLVSGPVILLAPAAAIQPSITALEAFLRGLQHLATIRINTLSTIRRLWLLKHWLSVEFCHTTTQNLN